MTAREELGYKPPELCAVHGFMLPCSACAYFLRYPSKSRRERPTDATSDAIAGEPRNECEIK